MMTHYTHIIVGGGAYGCYLALKLSELIADAKVLIVEKEPDLLLRASYHNQARVHNGYHYPRSILTGLRSRINFAHFIQEFPECIENNFEKVYAIAHKRSKVTARQFYQFCQRINAPIKIAPESIQKLFNPDLIEKVFVVSEYAFNADILRTIFLQRLAQAQIDILTRTEAQQVIVKSDSSGQPQTYLQIKKLQSDQVEQLACEYIYNCTYANLNQLSRKFGLETTIACGLDQAIGDIVIILRPECDPPELIPEFVKQAQLCQGIVIGKRNLWEHNSWLYVFTYNLYFSLCKIFLERPQIYCATHFMAFTRTALNSILKIKDTYRYIRVLSMYAGYQIKELRYKQIIRRSQPRRRQLLPLINSSVSTIVSNSILPLRLAALFSIVASLLNFGYIGYILFFKVFLNSVEGWASSSAQNSIMFGLIFAIFAVICEYLARLIEEVKIRPLYFIRDEIESNVMLSSEIRNVVYQEQNFTS